MFSTTFTLPRILISGLSGGSGKTTLSLGLARHFAASFSQTPSLLSNNTGLTSSNTSSSTISQGTDPNKETVSSAETYCPLRALTQKGQGSFFNGQSPRPLELPWQEVRSRLWAKRPVQTFKKGPDYIDAAWLGLAAGCITRTLDPYFSSPQALRHMFMAGSCGADFALIEGNRGIHDGLDHLGSCSSATLAKLLQTPVLLVVDCTKMTRTVAALILGCVQLDSDVTFGGVVLNKLGTDRQENIIRQAIEYYTDVPVVGAIPRQRVPLLPERKLGLGAIQDDSSTQLDTIRQFIGSHVDFQAVWRLASSASPMEFPSTATVANAALNAPRLPDTALSSEERDTPSSSSHSFDSSVSADSSDASGSLGSSRTPDMPLYPHNFTTAPAPDPTACNPSASRSIISGPACTTTPAAPQGLSQGLCPAKTPTLNNHGFPYATPSHAVPHTTPFTAPPASPSGVLPPPSGHHVPKNDNQSFASKECAPTIGYIYDEAIWFYYIENLEALHQAGAKLQRLSLFSPQDWNTIDGVYIGGGYVDAHARKISQSPQLSLLSLYAHEGMPLYLEGSGLVLACRELIIGDSSFPMAGIFNASMTLSSRPLGLGYTESCVSGPTPFFDAQTTLRGHQFNFFAFEAPHQLPTALTQRKGRGLFTTEEPAPKSQCDGLIYKNTCASLSSIFAPTMEQWAPRFVKLSQSFRHI